MSLTYHEVELLWRVQENVVFGRSSRRVLDAMLVLPLALLFPLLIARFSPGVVKGCAIACGIYLLYGSITYVVWRWFGTTNGSVSQRRITMLLVLGFDGLSLLFLSLTCLSAAILGLGTESLAFSNNAIIWAVVAVYAADIVFLLAWAPHFLRNRINNPVHSPTSLEMRRALAIQSGIVSAGIVLAVILKRTAYGRIIALGSAVLVAFLLLPFGLTILYGVIVMAWGWAYRKTG